MIILAVICMFHWNTWPQSKAATAAIMALMMCEISFEIVIIWQLAKHWM